jgi:hypothetical protein
MTGTVWARAPRGQVAAPPGGRSSPAASFDHFISAGEKRGRDRQTERLRGLEIDGDFVSGRRLHWHIGRLFTFEDATDVAGGTAVKLVNVNAVGHQTAGSDKVPVSVHRLPQGERRGGPLIRPTVVARFPRVGWVRRPAGGPLSGAMEVSGCPARSSGPRTGMASRRRTQPPVAAGADENGRSGAV